MVGVAVVPRMERVEMKVRLLTLLVTLASVAAAGASVKWW